MFVICTYSCSDFDNSNLLSLCKYTKLRTLFCKKQLGKKTGSVMDHWCTELQRMRVISCASTSEVPDSIGNLKHLRYLEISRASPFKSIPSTFCGLYNLQIFYAAKCKLESLPSEFDKLISLQKLLLRGFEYCPGYFPIHYNAAVWQEQEIILLKNLNQVRGHLCISNVGMLSKENAAEAELKNKKYLDELTLDWSCWASTSSHGYQISQNNAVEVLQVLRPPSCLKYLSLRNYPGVSLPSWFQPENLTSLVTLRLITCQGLTSIPGDIWRSSLASLEELDIWFCPDLVSIGGAEAVAKIKYVGIRDCPNLEEADQIKNRNRYGRRRRPYLLH